ncbi:hypothetical protein HPB52_013560 [Rhipicephalus sanguineus]|uniref:Uncharacterized protein n=1 Tax=Rhipicephalus sanguineus TaxID=34632 RepID=A0A9D4PWG0_RHISA|nr:hypothetical protein HPB52_013560 [Rhipicephalus sanguineus]
MHARHALVARSSGVARVQEQKQSTGGGCRDYDKDSSGEVGGATQSGRVHFASPREATRMGVQASERPSTEGGVPAVRTGPRHAARFVAPRTHQPDGSRRGARARGGRAHANPDRAEPKASRVGEHGNLCVGAWLSRRYYASTRSLAL